MQSLLSPPSETDTLCAEIDGIEIHEALGAGGMGIVFRGVRESDGEPLAVKVLPRGLSADPEWRERFQREAAALSALDHPNIVRILGSGETLDGRLYLAMELVEGCDLRRLLRTGKLEPARALDIAEKVAAGLAHAHQRGIVHRDIKPGNILVGDGGVVKVADFGIARAISGVASSFTLTQTREVFGTPYYIAPEVTANASPASPASDVYALGVMLYEMLTGRVPMGKFTPASQEDGVDRRADAVIAAALQDNPAARTAGMEEMHRSLRALQSRLKRHVVNRRRRLAAGIAAALAVCAGASVWITRCALVPSEGSRFTDAAAATRDHPWQNSLGMKFVPVPGTRVLFSIWETRRQDYRAYAVENSLPTVEDGIDPSPLKMHTLREGREVFDNSNWLDPGFEQAEDHPVVGINILNANHFCRWLTTRERTEGRLRPGQRYRLPGTAEWETAFNSGPPAPGNVCGREVLSRGWPASLPHGDTTDPFPRTAPVASFSPNILGIYDLSGNVMEACVNLTSPGPKQMRRNFQTEINVRGDSWRGGDLSDQTVPEARAGLKPFLRRADAGFRVVLELAPADPEK
jgi:serine/threonine protein kinase